MGFVGSLLEIVGFGIGIPLGFFIGFYFFIYSHPLDVQDPVIRPLYELDTDTLEDLMAEIPLWVKNPDYDRVDWLNKFVSNIWPYLDKTICGMIKCTAEPIFAEFIGQYQIEAIEFVKLNIGTLPPIIQGLKVHQTNEKALVMEPVIKWAGNPNIIVALKVLSMRIPVQLTDLQVFATPRITLKPLVPTFPCFANISVSLTEKPCIDFGLKLLGGDIMSIPGLYQLVQDTIKKQVATLFLWPRTIEIPVLDASMVAIKKPVGLLHVKVVRAMKLLKMDLLGTSDPYVKLSLSGERLPAKKTTVKKKSLNPEWNENFKLIVKEPEIQVLNLNVYDWDKVGGHDKLGMQAIPLKLLTPNETKEFKLELLKNTNISDPQNKKQRGHIVIELRYAPFKEENERSLNGGGYSRKESGNGCEISSTGNESPSGNEEGAGLLTVTVHGAEDVEGESHNNPYVLLTFRGEQKKSKMIKKTRDPMWNEEFQYMLEEPPVGEKIHIQVLSKKTGISFGSKDFILHYKEGESLGHVEINLGDVVHNRRINQKYHLIDSKNGVLHVELRWKSI